MVGLWKYALFITLIKFSIIYGKQLSGDHICVTEKIFLVNSTEFYMKNVTIRHYKWCLNYPPRCSYYTVNSINTTKIVEKNETGLVEECCPSFKEHHGKCISLCTNCKNGICENGSCTCFTGFKGDNCDIECSSKEWGPNCSKLCDCDQQNCDSLTGVCFKQVTTEATSITSQDNKNRYDSMELITQSVENITKNMNATVFNENEMVYSFTKQKIDAKTVTENLKNIDLETKITTENSLTTNFNKSFSNVQTIDTVNLKNITKHSIEKTDKKFFTDHFFPIKTYPNGTIATKLGLLIPVEIQYDKLQTNISNNTKFVSNEEYLNKQDNTFKDLILFTVAIMVAFIGVLVILTINIMKKRKLGQNVQSDNNHTAIFSASIFESPLPAIREYEYDHPTSTGSYNPPSVFKPVELKIPPIFEPTSEPIYDEIPQKDFNCSDIHSAIYVNTLGRTKL